MSPSSRNYDLVIEFMWENSFMKNIVYKGLELLELEDMKQVYSAYARHILRNECSIMMINEDETEILAVGLLEWMTDDWHSWTFLPHTMPKGLFQQIILMKSELIKSTKKNLKQATNDCLMLHEMAIPEYLYEDKDFLICFFDVVGMVAQHMHMPRACFIALSSIEQDMSELAEYDEIGRTIYSIYKVENKRPFDILRELDEMYAVLYELPVQPILHYMLMPGFEEFHEALRVKAEKKDDFD